jgi:uncharacterized protein YndB with AHSA1/START domain
MPIRETRVLRRIGAPTDVVYRLLLGPQTVSVWKVRDGMTCLVQTFETWEGGNFRVSLSYLKPGHEGKSAQSTDTYSGVVIRLVPDTEVVERMRFDTVDAATDGWMEATYQLRPVGVDTEVQAVHSGVPERVSFKDNQLGWSISPGKLARLAEARTSKPTQALIDLLAWLHR